MKNNYIGYEYKDVAISEEKQSFYLDCYENFGWIADENSTRSTLRLKRDRKILNKVELTRLERNFEACIHEIQQLEKSKTSTPSAYALVVAILGTVFMAGATFAVVHNPPIIWLCVLLAIPGFLGWITPFFIYRHFVLKQTIKLSPLIEEKQDEIHSLCEKAYALL